MRRGIFRARRFLGVRVGPIYVVVKDTRLPTNPAHFMERHRQGCWHITARGWRFLVMW